MGLDDLPEVRREWLLWRFRFELDWVELDELVSEIQASGPCRSMGTSREGPPLRTDRWIDVSHRVGRVRARLVEVFGDRCAVCGTPAWMLDHDHVTGLVRGLLCGPCNTNVDLCPHVSGCPFADYLRDPPAAYLRLRYPYHARAIRNCSYLRGEMFDD